MNYDAITFDTQTVMTNGFDFDGGYLHQLKQFKDRRLKILVPEMVVREISKKLAEKIKEAKDTVLSGYKKASLYGLLNEADHPFNGKHIDYKKVADGKLKTYLDAIGAELLPLDVVSIRELSDLYFTGRPPFATSGQKKNEFPDAISLLTLENWSKTYGKKVLLISGDKDWHAFADISLSMECVGEIGDALPILQSTPSRLDGIDMVLERLSGKVGPLADSLFMRVSEELSEHQFYADADSYHMVETDQIDIELLDYEFQSKEDKTVYDVVNFEDDEIVLRLPLHVKINAEADFTMSVYDSIDKDYVSLGGVKGRARDEFDIEILATFEGALSSDGLELMRVDLVKAPDEIRFGYIEPDYGYEE